MTEGDKNILLPIGNKKQYFGIPLATPSEGDKVALIPIGSKKQYAAVNIGTPNEGGIAPLLSIGNKRQYVALASIGGIIKVYLDDVLIESLSGYYYREAATTYNWGLQRYNGTGRAHQDWPDAITDSHDDAGDAGFYEVIFTVTDDIIANNHFAALGALADFSSGPLWACYFGVWGESAWMGGDPPVRSLFWYIQYGKDSGGNFWESYTDPLANGEHTFRVTYSRWG